MQVCLWYQLLIRWAFEWWVCLNTEFFFSKVDLQNANVEEVSDQLEELIGHRPLYKVCCVCMWTYVCTCMYIPQCNKLVCKQDMCTLKVSAKHGDRVEELLPAVVAGVNRYMWILGNTLHLSTLSPPGNRDGPLRLFLIDCWYELHRGVVCLMVVTDGSISRGMLM